MSKNFLVQVQLFPSDCTLSQAVYKSLTNLASDYLINPFEKRSKGTARTIRSTNVNVKSRCGADVILGPWW